MDCRGLPLNSRHDETFVELKYSSVEKKIALVSKRMAIERYRVGETHRV